MLNPLTYFRFKSLPAAPRLLFACALGALWMLFLSCGSQSSPRFAKAKERLDNPSTYTLETARKLEETNNLVEIYRIRQAVQQNPAATEQTRSLALSRWEDKLAQIEPQTMLPGLDFLAAQLDATGEQEYTLRSLFHCTANIVPPEGHRYGLTYTARFDKSHRQAVPDNSAGNPDKGYIWWGFHFWKHPEMPYMQDWKPGQYYLLEQTVTTFEHIPYDIQISIPMRSVSDNRYVRNVGERASAGWLADF